MSQWTSRPAEERALLNPSFCSCLLWQASVGYESISHAPLPFDISFLVLPTVVVRSNSVRPYFIPPSDAPSAIV